MCQNDRKNALLNLVNLNKNLKQIKKDIGKFSFDNDFELFTITKEHIITMLKKAIKNQISYLELEEWANLIECRDDLGFENEYIQEIIFELANSDINGDITEEKIHNIIYKLENQNGSY